MNICNRCRLVAWTFLVGLPAGLWALPQPLLRAAQNVGSASTTSDPIADTCSETDQFTFTDIGVVMDATKLGVPVGSTIADSTGYVTPEGGVRIYFYSNYTRNILSAISSDGITFSVEGVRIRTSGHFKIIKLADGRLRLFNAQGLEDIVSYISSDGLTFTQESGVRISRTDAGMPDGMIGLTVVPTFGGGYRGYFSDLARPDVTPGGHFIKSATSTDLLTWTVESGVRIGKGAPTLTDSAEQPHALLRGNNCVTLFYFGQGTTYYSTSTGGLTFTSQNSLSNNGNGPSIIRMPDGTYLLYYDVGNE